jgi:hypothetical protein
MKAVACKSSPSLSNSLALTNGRISGRDERVGCANTRHAPPGHARSRLTPPHLRAGSRDKTRGGQHRYSDLAIETALTLGLVFGLRLRQAESVLQLMGLALAVPDHTTLRRRARTWQSPNKRQDRQGRPDGPLHGHRKVIGERTWSGQLSGFSGGGDVRDFVPRCHRCTAKVTMVGG